MKKQTALRKKRERLKAERAGRYRAFESGTSKAQIRSHLCASIDPELAEHARLWAIEWEHPNDPVSVETESLDEKSWLQFAEDLLTATNETLFVVLVGGDIPVAGAICSKEATIDILEEVLSRETGVFVLYLSSPGGFDLYVSDKEHSQHGIFSVSAWGAGKVILSGKIEQNNEIWSIVENDV